MMHLAPLPHARSHVRPASPSTWTRLARTLRWLSLLAAAHAALSAAGRVLPAPPAPWSGGDLAGWLTTTDPGTSAFTLLRLLALAAAWYLTVLTALVLLSRLSGVPRLIRLADRAALPVVRRALHHALGVGLAVTIVGSSGPLLTGLAPAGAEPVTEPVVTMQVIEDEHGPPGASPPDARPADARPPGASDGAEVHMVLLEEAPAPAATPVPPPPPSTTAGDTAPAPPAPPTAGPERADPAPSIPPSTVAASMPAPATPGERDLASAPPDPTRAANPVATTPGDAPVAPGAHDIAPIEGEPAGEAAAVGSAAAEWTISPGDHLWHVAEQTLHDAWQRPPTDTETADYWRGLIADNRDRLADADNPDLVFPGQRFRLPPVPTG